MAISKIVYKSSPSATGETWMDVTQKTVTSSTMLNGTTALKNDGTDITGNIASKTSSNLSASGATVTAEAGYYASSASKTVASGTEGTPTATKGTVSNHAVSVTPSVTNTAGYISGGTKTGTAVTVSVAELESGTKSITANGTGISVSGYSAVDVAVPTGGGVTKYYLIKDGKLYNGFSFTLAKSIFVVTEETSPEDYVKLYVNGNDYGYFDSPLLSFSGYKMACIEFVTINGANGKSNTQNGINTHSTLPSTYTRNNNCAVFSETPRTGFADFACVSLSTLTSGYIRLNIESWSNNNAYACIKNLYLAGEI